MAFATWLEPSSERPSPRSRPHAAGGTGTQFRATFATFSTACRGRDCHRQGGRTCGAGSAIGVTARRRAWLGSRARRCSGLGQPGNGLLKVLDRRPHLDRRSRLASRPGRVTPARHSAAAQRSRRRPLPPNPTGRIQPGTASSSRRRKGVGRFDVDVAVLSRHRQLSHRLSAVHEAAAIPAAARPPVHPSGKHGAAVRDVAPPTAAGAAFPAATGLCRPSRVSGSSPRVRGAPVTYWYCDS